MNSPASNSDSPTSSNFTRLHPLIQRWIWEAGWTELRDAQERAIPAILEGKRDVIIAAATAAGKTEAAFLPILTALLEEKRSSVLYISPLKALINDQWERLEGLCERLEIPVTPWHGDVGHSRRQRFLNNPQGVVLITPESLEALHMNRGHNLPALLAGLRYLVVDELHAFIGTERGKQLQSLLHRIETAVGRQIPRIGLSATLGDMGLASDFLRPGSDAELIESKESGQALKVLVKGYLRKHSLENADSDASASPQTELAIAEHLFKTLRGANHLIFPNSRGRVEVFADLLRQLSEAAHIPNEFWPHHGNLAKDIREETEAALKRKDRPATAICTTTLELGIDIGAVKSVAQIGSAPSVASLRQRLGRSGRRKGEPAILRCYAEEDEITSSTPLADQLRYRLVLAAAQIRLLVAGWCEPPRPHGLHLSTLIQQLLSALAQYGGLTAARAWRLLCETGPFTHLGKREFAELLRALGEKEVIIQETDGLLLHGPLGERLISHYSFYAAFASDEEFRLVWGNRTLGSIPVSSPLAPGSYVIFAGKRWQVVTLDEDKKIIEVVPDRSGRAPLFGGTGGKVHNRVREEMRKILQGHDAMPFLDSRATECLEEARNVFGRLELDKQVLVPAGKELLVFLWQGDWIQDTLALMLSARGLDAFNAGPYLSVRGVSSEEWLKTLRTLVETPPSEAELMAKVLNPRQEKWDFLLPDGLLSRNYASQHLDIEGTVKLIARLAQSDGQEDLL